MSEIKYYTNKQLEVEKWLNQMGFQTELEKSFGPFCGDIFLHEINWVIEVDGPGHWSKKDKKRDDYLNKNFNINTIIHVAVDITKEQFSEIFEDSLERMFGEDKNESNGIEKGDK